MAKIGVFDSGIGGLSVVKAIKKALPMHEVFFANDSKNIPYGTKTPTELKKLVMPILQNLVDDGCEVIVIACNTVSTTLIDELREQISVPLVAMEPMIKPAALRTKSKVIAVFATPTTLGSPRYSWLKENYAKSIKVIEPDCSDWAGMIEADQVDHDKIRQLTDRVCKSGADTIVLGCTHYHWIEEDIIEATVGRAVVMQPEQPVITRLKQLLG